MVKPPTKSKKERSLAEPDDKLAAALDLELKRMEALKLDVGAALANVQPKTVRLDKFTMAVAGEFLIEVAHTSSVKQSCINLGISRTSYNNFIAKHEKGKRLWFAVQLLTNPKEKSRAKAIRNYFDETYNKPKRRRLTKK